MTTKLPKMNKVEMVRSDISGQFFPSDECEIVVIKIVKHRDEKMTAFNPVAPRTIEPVKIEPAKEEIRGNDIKSVPAALDFGSKEGNAIMQKTHSLIPPQFRNVFSAPPGTEGMI
jgi:hypothetical protein